MSNTERLVKFELLGQEYKFYTAASEDELKSILSLVRQLVEAGSAQITGTLPVGRVAVMACLNIASQYVKLKQEFDDYRWDSEQRMVRLSEESLALLNPDVYLLQEGAMNKNPMPLEQRPHFRTLAAVRNNFVFRVAESRFSRPGPQSVLAVEELSVILMRWHEAKAQPR